MARLVRLAPVRWSMAVALRLVVPRQRIGVCIVAFDDQKRVLLLRHVFHPFAPWGVPGGWLGRNEDPATGAARELKEETGLTAVIGQPIYVTHEQDPPHVGIAFTARVQPGPLSLSGEILEARWCDTDNLPGPMLPFIRASIETAVALQNASQPILYEENYE